METKTAAQLVQEAKQCVQNLTVAQVATELEQGAVTLIDIREPAEQQNGMIPGAIHAPCGMLEFYTDPTNPYHRPEFAADRRIILRNKKKPKQ